MEPKRIGRRIKAFRKLKGYTQANFAKELDTSLSFIGAVERGAKEAPEELLDKISSLLSISKEELLLIEGYDHLVLEENFEAGNPDVSNK